MNELNIMQITPLRRACGNGMGNGLGFIYVLDLSFDSGVKNSGTMEMVFRNQNVREFVANTIVVFILSWSNVCMLCRPDPSVKTK